MTAAELASFRALLRTQAAAAPPARGLLARLALRRTRRDTEDAVIAPAPTAAPVGEVGCPATAATQRWTHPPAAPPPARPPLFGRREEEEEPPEPLLLSRPAARLSAPVWNGELATPEVAPDRSGAARPGVIAGWSRSRPPSAQRRVLARLEAVFDAERLGLDARRAALQD